MALLYGKHYTKTELLARVGDISQLARLKPYRLTEGFEDGVQAIDVTNGSGLDFTVLPSRGMDISSAHFNGRPLAWRSTTTDSHPAYFDHEGENGRGWLRGFFGGLLVTCGLSWVGANDSDNGQQYGIHGRISNTPATNVSCSGEWVEDEYHLTIKGTLREATVFGENLQLTRTIQTTLGSKHLVIDDTVENLGFKPAEHMILYHINVGFPAVNDNAELVSTSKQGIARDAISALIEDKHTQFQPPQVGYEETVYFHDMAADEQGYAYSAVIDDEYGVYCRYKTATLPRFIEWKMMAAGTYVVGMEPANCLVMGRRTEREAGTLKVLKPGETCHYHVEIGALSGKAEIEAFRQTCTKI